MEDLAKAPVEKPRKELAEASLKPVTRADGTDIHNMV